MRIGNAYFEMVEARIEQFKANVAVTKAETKVQQAKKEMLSKVDRLEALVLERLEAPKAYVKTLRNKGDETVEFAKAGAKTVQSEVRDLLTDTVARIKQLARA